MAQGIIRSAIRYSPLPSESIDSARAIADPRAESQSYFSRYGANPLRYTDEVNETEAISRGLGSMRLTAKLPAGFSLETSLGGNFEQRGNDSYFPRTVFEGSGTSGLAIVASAEYRNLVQEDLVKYLERSLKQLETLSEQIKNTQGFTEDVEVYQIIKELILEQKTNANTHTANRKAG